MPDWPAMRRHASRAFVNVAPFRSRSAAVHRAAWTGALPGGIYRAEWTGLPRAESDASRNVSASVGCAWIVAATSSTVASSRIASVASAISSEACGPTMWTPTMR